CLHQNHIFAIRPVLASLLPGFLSRMMESHHGRSYFYLTSKRTTNLASTNQTTLGLLPLFLPNIEEQTQIARFVDWKTAQINKFIRNKRRLIELLKEQKQNVINQAVTRGLDSNVKFKPSGVEWIGDISEHWEVAPLKHLASIDARVLPESTDENYTFKYFDISSVGTGRLTAEPETMRFGQAPSRARRILKRGDTILSTVRTYLKAVFYVSDEVEDWIASTGFAALTPKKAIHPPFLGLVIQSDNFINRVIRESIGVACISGHSGNQIGHPAFGLPRIYRGTAGDSGTHSRFI
ncbi:MAG: restriction endonuclease subunit S, partial [Gammaproteobacteria bacterium]